MALGEWRLVPPGPQSLRGFGPQGAVGRSERLDVLVLSEDHHARHNGFAGGGSNVDASSWSGWSDLDGNLAAPPSAVSWGPGRLDTFAIGADGHHVYHQ